MLEARGVGAEWPEPAENAVVLDPGVDEAGQLADPARPRPEPEDAAAAGGASSVSALAAGSNAPRLGRRGRGSVLLDRPDCGATAGVATAGALGPGLRQRPAAQGAELGGDDPRPG